MQQNKKNTIKKCLFKRDSIITLVWQRINIILVFFGALLLFTFTSLFTFNLDNKTYNRQETLPKIEIIDFMLHRFNDTNIGMTITGNNAKQFIDKEIYNNFIADKINDDGIIEHLEGKEVWHIGDEYDFTAGIQYTKTPHIKFFSEKGVYNNVTEVFSGSGNFFIEDNDMKTIGQNISYDKKTDTITAQNITTKIFKSK